MRALYCVNTNGVGSALVAKSIFATLQPCIILLSHDSRLHNILKSSSLLHPQNHVVFPAFSRHFVFSALIKIFPFSRFFFSSYTSLLICDDIPFLFVPRQILFLQQMSLFMDRSFKWRILRLYFRFSLPRCSSIIVQSEQMSAYLRRFYPSISQRIVIFNHVLPS